MERKKTALLTGNKEGCRVAAELLVKGELVALPTETVYGLGGLASSEQAIRSVFNVKGRPADNPLILHVANSDQIESVARTNEMAHLLAEKFMPGPLTIVLSARETVPAIARAGLPTVAIRVPDHPLALDVIGQSGPIVAPSANRSGRPSPTMAEHVLADLDGRISAILDGGRCSVGIESTIVDLSSGRPIVLRPGVISAEMLGDVLGVPPLKSGGESSREGPLAPGMKYRHSAPTCEIVLLPLSVEEIETLSDQLMLYFKGDEEVRLLCQTELVTGLSQELSRAVRPLEERTLYQEFRTAEKEGIERLVLLFDESAISDALLNRIRKAAGEERK